ncbi:hypothetical protein [Bradyrhizobium diazoefficiens]
MHTAMAMGGGILLLGLFVLFGNLWGGAGPGLGLAAKAFIPIWLLLSLSNMWVGITKAGYSAREELPIFVLVFSAPALIAVAAIWYFSR